MHTITAIVTQGRLNYFMKTFSIKYSNDSDVWKDSVSETSGAVKVGNLWSTVKPIEDFSCWQWPSSLKDYSKDFLTHLMLSLLSPKAQKHKTI